MNNFVNDDQIESQKFKISLNHIPPFLELFLNLLRIPLNQHHIFGEMQNMTENIEKKCLDISRHILLLVNLKIKNDKNKERGI